MSYCTVQLSLKPKNPKPAETNYWEWHTEINKPKGKCSKWSSRAFFKYFTAYLPVKSFWKLNCYILIVFWKCFLKMQLTFWLKNTRNSYQRVNHKTSQSSQTGVKFFVCQEVHEKFDTLHALQGDSYMLTELFEEQVLCFSYSPMESTTISLLSPLNESVKCQMPLWN